MRYPTIHPSPPMNATGLRRVLTCMRRKSVAPPNAVPMSGMQRLLSSYQRTSVDVLFRAARSFAWLAAGRRAFCRTIAAGEGIRVDLVGHVPGVAPEARASVE